MPRHELQLDEVLSRLEAGPGRIASLTEGLSGTRLHTPPSRGGWSANDILAHVRACHDVWSMVAASLSSDGRSPRTVPHPRRYVDKTGYVQLDFALSLAAFAAGRVELMRTLKALPAETWGVAGPARGWTLVSNRSLLAQATGIVEHEGIHIDQIEAAVKH